MAVAIALYALGVTFEDSNPPRSHGETLVILAVGLGIVATIIVGGDLIYLVVPHLRRVRTSRRTSLKLGSIDYVPEFQSASKYVTDSTTGLGATMRKLSAALTSHTQRFRKETDPAKRQAIAADTAAEMDRATAEVVKAAPILVAKSNVMRQASTGFLKESRDSAAALRQFMNSTRGMRINARGARQSVKTLRDKARWLRRLNLSYKINQAADDLQKATNEYQKVMSKADRNWRGIEGGIRRKLWWVAIRKLVPIGAAPQRPPDS